MCDYDYLSPGKWRRSRAAQLLDQLVQVGLELDPPAKCKLAELDWLNQVLTKNLCLESFIYQPAGGDVVDVVLGEEGVSESGNDQLKVQSRAWKTERRWKNTFKMDKKTNAKVRIVTWRASGAWRPTWRTWGLGKAWTCGKRYLQ